jgi:hypothetical protein
LIDAVQRIPPNYDPDFTCHTGMLDYNIPQLLYKMAKTAAAMEITNG